MIQYYREETLHRDEVEEMFHRWARAEAAQHQGLAVFVADLGIKMAQLGHESLLIHLGELIVHP